MVLFLVQKGLKHKHLNTDFWTISYVIYDFGVQMFNNYKENLDQINKGHQEALNCVITNLTDQVYLDQCVTELFTALV